MKLSEYLLDRIFSLICMLVAALVLLALLWLIETPAVFILFAEVILLAAYSTALLYDFFRKQSFYNLLQKMTEQMDIKTLLGELMVPPHFLEGQILVDVLRCCNNIKTTDFPMQSRRTVNIGNTLIHGCMKSKRLSPLPG